MSKILRLKPRLSEKTYALSEQCSTYVFDVPADANRQAVAAAVTSQYEVGVKSVRIAHSAPKPLRSYRKRGRGLVAQSAGVRKAYVTLKDGDSLPMFDSPSDEADNTSTKIGTKEKK